jgi:putative transposase
MRELEIRGVSRIRNKVFTTRQDPDAWRAPDLVNRDFTADRPDALWVTDLTYVPTRSGMAYVCFMVDAFSRRIVGWRVAFNMRTEMVLDALEMARVSRGARRLVGLVTHSDAGSQGELNRSSQHLVDGGGCRWRRCGSGSERFSCIGGRCRLRVGRRSRGARTGSGSGLRSLVG